MILGMPRQRTCNVSGTRALARNCGKACATTGSWLRQIYLHYGICEELEDNSLTDERCRNKSTIHYDQSLTVVNVARVSRPVLAACLPKYVVTVALLSFLGHTPSRSNTVQSRPFWSRESHRLIALFASPLKCPWRS